MLEWSQELELGQSGMDGTPREFVEGLDQVGVAGEAGLLEQLDASNPLAGQKNGAA